MGIVDIVDVVGGRGSADPQTTTLKAKRLLEEQRLYRATRPDNIYSSGSNQTVSTLLTKRIPDQVTWLQCMTFFPAHETSDVPDLSATQAVYYVPQSSRAYIGSHKLPIRTTTTFYPQHAERKWASSPANPLRSAPKLGCLL